MKNQFGSYKSTISSWPAQDRPREKLMCYGEKSLSNSELLAILLGSGRPGYSALDIAREVMQKFKTFYAMSDVDSSEWKQIKGLGTAKLAKIRAALEIGRRFRLDDSMISSSKILTSDQAAKLLIPLFRGLPKEVFRTIHLNAAHQIIEIVEEAQGTVNYTTPIVREIFYKAIKLHSVAVIGAHNHPSGDVTPSEDDHQFTRIFKDAGKVLQIRVLDHIIVGQNSYYSFADSGHLT